MRVLVTGGTGNLGRQLLPKLHQAGHEVVALSRRPLPADVPASHAPGDLSTGEGLENALSGCDAVLHAATAGFGDRYTLRWAIFHRSAVDVRGTQMLLEAARRQGTSHFLFTSIVGMDRVPYWPNIYRFFKHKLAAERLVRQSSIPWTIARFTQFHPLLDQIFTWQFGMRSPVIVLDAQGQPIDPSDAADAAISLLEGDPARDLLEFGGPEVLTARAIVDAWTTRRGIDRKTRFYRVPGKLGRAMAGGALTAPEHAISDITWKEWLSRN